MYLLQSIPSQPSHGQLVPTQAHYLNYAKGRCTSIGLPEQAMGRLPLRFGIEDKPILNFMYYVGVYF